MLRQRFQQVLGRDDLYPRDSLTIERDGHRERYIATVVEREYLPGKTSAGGRPFVRRLLIAWNAELHRGFVITTNDSVSRVSPRALLIGHSDSSSARPWERVALVDASADDGSDRWTGTTGEVRLLVGARFAACPAGGPYARHATDVGPYIEWLVSYEDCGRYRYRVSVSAEAEKAASARSSNTFSRLFGHPMSIRIPEQELPGTHIVETCRNVDWIPTACDVFNFWRSPSDFAAIRGAKVPLDFNKLEPIDQYAGVFHQTVSPGSGPLVRCCGFYDGPVKYTMYSPTGRVLMEATLPNARADTLHKFVRSIDALVRYGSRTLYYFRAIPYRSPAILDLTLLPCPHDPPIASGSVRGKCIDEPRP
jgi:hypothetical protein